ncbi:uncharacterized protein BX664DRAFT_358506 [Halteromyces radiatus]|uniref:uncharacterized protein n=1 Tax=Halteromyces radiatus TaxID=101107 RepID=UPI002220E1FC|nr:uncharacterized protein BX664DRAFT_358506 [Halteromyces radiatus]KAI8088876.1 hypothetical protein BX664DRAFT_358506 [Halteromyces radiatus]
MDKRQDGIVHMCLLVMIQWISIAVVVLNSVAYSMSQQHPLLDGKLVSSQSGPQDILLIVLGVTSFLAASLPLCLHLYIYYRSNGACSFSPSKIVLISELCIGVVMVTLWTAASSIVLTHFHVSSSCRLDVVNDLSACKMLDMAITIGIVAIAGWVMMLIIASISISRLPAMPSFILEQNPYHAIGYPLEQEQYHVAAPPYSSLPQPPPPLLLSSQSRKSYLRSNAMEDMSSNDIRNGEKKQTFMGDVDDYPTDMKYPLYNIDSLPTIQIGVSKFDISFMS